MGLSSIFLVRIYFGYSIRRERSNPDLNAEEGGEERAEQSDRLNRSANRANFSVSHDRRNLNRTEANNNIQLADHGRLNLLPGKICFTSENSQIQTYAWISDSPFLFRKCLKSKQIVRISDTNLCVSGSKPMPKRLKFEHN